jgi:O-antigen/teichoic acid export membrane protein
LCSISGQILYYSDTVIIGIFLGPTMVAFYAVASMMVIYSRDIIMQCNSVFVPETIRLCAQEDWLPLQWLVLRASNLVMAFAIPMLFGMIFLGREFIVLWMGEKFSIIYPVLLILCVTQFPVYAMSVTSAIYLGLDKMRLGAILGIAQAVLNVGLSVWLLAGWKWGLVGIAWGAFIPRTIFPLIAGGYALTWIGLPLRKFLFRLGPRWIALGAAVASTCIAINAQVVQTGWFWFFAKVIAVVILSAILALVIILDGKQKSEIRKSFIKKLVKPVMAGEGR